MTDQAVASISIEYAKRALARLLPRIEFEILRAAEHAVRIEELHWHEELWHPSFRVELITGGEVWATVRL
jgi:hypothetical protein